MITFTSKHSDMGFRHSTAETADKEKGIGRKTPFSLFDFQVHRILRSCAIACNRRFEYSTFMITFTSKHNGVDFHSSTVQAADKEKENKSKFPFSLFNIEVRKT